MQHFNENYKQSKQAQQSNSALKYCCQSDDQLLPLPYQSNNNGIFVLYCYHILHHQPEATKQNFWIFMTGVVSG